MNRWVGRLVLAVVGCAGFTAVAQAQDGPALPIEVAAAEAAISPEMIARHPSPAVDQLSANDDILYDRWYLRVTDAVDIYDAPNGSITSRLDAGFNYVTGQGSADDGWLQINRTQWIRADATYTVRPSAFAGVLLPEAGLPYPTAWVLVPTVPSRVPGAEPLEADASLSRYTQVYLYSQVEIDGWRWYQIGVDQWMHQTLVAKIIPVERPADVDTERWVSIDLYEQVLIAYEGTQPVFATLISSGLEQWPTREGLFHVYIRYTRTIMSGAHGRPDFYYLEEVPWTMYFDGDIGLHGTYWHDDFGYRHSHGCVNLSILDAHWLYQFLAPEFDPEAPDDLGAAVYVYSSGTYR
jgi:lipoprotein-anchoring transpeptidase ErfK/SrfK